MDPATTRDQTWVGLTGFGLMLVMAPTFVGLMYLNGRRFDPGKVIGCYQGAGTPMLQVSLSKLRSDQARFQARGIKIAEEKQGYGFRLSPGLELGGSLPNYRLEAAADRNWITIDTRRNGGTMILSLTNYRGEVGLPKVPCRKA